MNIFPQTIPILRKTKKKKKKKPWENKVTALTFIIFFLGEKTHFFGKVTILIWYRVSRKHFLSG